MILFKIKIEIKLKVKKKKEKRKKFEKTLIGRNKRKK